MTQDDMSIKIAAQSLVERISDTRALYTCALTLRDIYGDAFATHSETLKMTRDSSYCRETLYHSGYYIAIFAFLRGWQEHKQRS